MVVVELASPLPEMETGDHMKKTHLQLAWSHLNLPCALGDNVWEHGRVVPPPFT